jgi:hypothetical protein
VGCDLAYPENVIKLADKYKMEKDNVRASYRNTRSKFYNKHSFEQDDQSDKYESKAENTGEYWKHKGN